MSKIAIVYHSGYGHTKVQAEAVARDIDAADAIIFGAPTYMGSVSAPLKAFMEASSKAWMEQRWKDKIAAGFTNSGAQSGDKLNA